MFFQVCIITSLMLLILTFFNLISLTIPDLFDLMWFDTPSPSSHTSNTGLHTCRDPPPTPSISHRGGPEVMRGSDSSYSIYIWLSRAPPGWALMSSVRGALCGHPAYGKTSRCRARGAGGESSPPDGSTITAEVLWWMWGGTFVCMCVFG